METMIGYKLFRIKKTRPGELFPLFIDKTRSVPIGKWVSAENIPTRGYAIRPGWHLGCLPKADHLLKRDGTFPENRVWTKVYFVSEIDYNDFVSESKTNDMKNVPINGFYYFKRPKHQGGYWIIADKIKVIKILSPEEIENINKECAGLV